MSLFMQLVPLITGGWLIFTSLIMDTKGMASGVIFKFIPFSLGLCSLFVGVKLLNWL